MNRVVSLLARLTFTTFGACVSLACGPSSESPASNGTSGTGGAAGQAAGGWGGAAGLSGSGGSGGEGTGKGDGGTPDGDTSGGDSAPPGGDDGTPTRQQCTSKFGSALSSNFGRLDGYLVSIVHPGTSGCNGDADHIHLQVNMKNAVYDVAVNVHSNQGTGSAADVLFLDKPLPSLPDGPWEEGWHSTATLDYVTDLGLHATDFAATPLAALDPEVEGKLASVNHISVFATGYGPAGIHLVHRNQTGQDGALVMNPLSSNPEAMLFHFSNQSF